MNPTNTVNIEDIPAALKSVVAALFPEGGWQSPPPAEAVSGFMKALCGAENDGALDFDALLERFTENIALVIAKTWVDKDEEARKERLRLKIGRFLDELRAGNYGEAIVIFGNIVNGLAILLFGEQAGRADFYKVVFRIDSQMGLFFWYGAHLDAFSALKDEDCRAVLLLGLSYLADF